VSGKLAMTIDPNTTLISKINLFVKNEEKITGAIDKKPQKFSWVKTNLNRYPKEPELHNFEYTALFWGLRFTMIRIEIFLKKFRPELNLTTLFKVI
jgi:hypothetical protein